MVSSETTHSVMWGDKGKEGKGMSWVGDRQAASLWSPKARSEGWPQVMQAEGS